MKVIRFFKKLFPNLRKHNFDLDNPEIVDTGREEKGRDGIRRPIRYTKYKCIKCGRILYLARWQMESLPIKMAYGCGNPYKKR